MDHPTTKRPRLDSVSPPYNAHTFAHPPPPHAPSSRPASHSAPTHASPPPPRHYPPHCLPPPPGQALYHSPSLPPSDIRSFADPRTIPSPSHRPNGLPGPPVTVGQDSISTYRPPPPPQSTSAPEPQGSRANSITVDVKPSPGMEHGGHQSPWSMTTDHRSNGSMSNGYNSAISPTHPTDQAFHPPPPPPGQYGQPVQYPAAPSPYMGQYASQAQSAQMRRKQVRATQACNHCRSRKQKCDEARPCQFCRENNFDCQYKDVPPPKQDRSMMQLQDSVTGMAETMTRFIEDLNAWRHSVDRRISPASGLDTNQPSSQAAFTVPQREHSLHRSSFHRVNSMKAESPTVPPSHMSPVNAQASTPIKHESVVTTNHHPAATAESVKTDRSGLSTKERDQLLAMDKPRLQSDHTTPAHNLLTEWKSMDVFWHGVDYLRRIDEKGHKVSDYPMLLEQSRGLIRVWGVGEGQDVNHGAQGPADPENSDPDAPSPAPAREGLWGHPPSEHSSPNGIGGGTPRDRSYSEGGMGPDGRPNFESKEMDRLLESYLTHIHTLHPFLNPSKLRKMVRDFSEQYSPDAKPASTATMAANQLYHGTKRKRSSSAFGEPYSHRGAIERSLRNAIVLLVLALGKVCSYKHPLPAPRSDRHGTWGTLRESSHSLPNGSFDSDTSDDTRPRNVDILPGMAYFSYATDILGNQHGGNTVAHAQAMILASLYLNQFARVLESWSWINSACRITMILIKADFKLLQKSYYMTEHAVAIAHPEMPAKERYRLELVMCVYWTCLQLESDIVAEMSNFPTSDITQHQSQINYPRGVYEHIVDDQGAVEERSSEQRHENDVMMVYSAQIWLRVILNEAHNALYGGNGQKPEIKDLREVPKLAAQEKNILESWRRLAPAGLRWDDSEPPPTNLNTARIRAKFYGALYMRLRPCLRFATEYSGWPPSHRSDHHFQHHPPAASSDGSTSTSRNIHMVELTPDQCNLVDVACECINAAIQSTIAFDRIGAPEDSIYEDFILARPCRLVVTNIFGTLHAQFGNMLVLAAVYRSRLYDYLPSDTRLTPKNLDALFKRTIQVLEEVAPNSPALKVDLDILHNVHELCRRERNGF